MIKIRFALFVLCFSLAALGQEESVRVGPGKAVEAITNDGGFRLSAKALKTIEVQLKTVEASTFTIPADALVFYGVKIGVYRQRDGLFRLVPVQIQKKTADSYTLQSTEIVAKDQIAVAGVALLRVSELDAFGGEQ